MRTPAAVPLRDEPAEDSTAARRIQSESDTSQAPSIHRNAMTTPIRVAARI